MSTTKPPVTATTVAAATRAAMGNDDAAPTPRPPGACYAGGCPCTGTIDTAGNGRCYCQWHSAAPPNKWPEVTHQLHAHKWLIDFMGEIQLTFERGRPNDWVAKAHDFFRTDEHCQPDAIERDGRCNFYLWRLREELAWRIGILKERPVPRLPMAQQQPKPRQQVLD